MPKAEILLHHRHDQLRTQIGEALDIEAGLAAIVPPTRNPDDDDLDGNPSIKMNGRPFPGPKIALPTTIIMSPIGAADPCALVMGYPLFKK